MAFKYPLPVYNKRIIIQSPHGSKDAYGERITVWLDVAEVWSAIMPLSSRELLTAGALHGEVTHKVQVRYNTCLSSADASWRIKYGERVFVLIGPPRNINEGNRVIEFICAEGMVKE